jgi:hypothetical protein
MSNEFNKYTRNVKVYNRKTRRDSNSLSSPLVGVGEGEGRQNQMFKVRTNVSQNYKEHVLRAEVWPSELPGQHSTKEDALVLYYEYYCPGCFTILDVEIAEKGAPPDLLILLLPPTIRFLFDLSKSGNMIILEQENNFN